jgi:flagellar biosynthesis chaperone FliJ
MGQLFNDNPKGTPKLKTLGYGTEEKAKNSIQKLHSYPKAYQQQAATTMYYRAKYHANQTKNMRKAMKVYSKFLKTLKKRRTD